MDSDMDRSKALGIVIEAAEREHRQMNEEPDIPGTEELGEALDRTQELYEVLPQLLDNIEQPLNKMSSDQDQTLTNEEPQYSSGDVVEVMFPDGSTKSVTVTGIVSEGPTQTVYQIDTEDGVVAVPEEDIEG